MPLSRIEELLRERIGVDAAALGKKAMLQVIRRRIATRGVDGFAEYEALLRGDPAELTELIEAIVVPETWFFRDADTWRALTEIARSRWSLRPGPRKILSVPCSTGEEPYSIAITLLEAGLPPDRFQIEAVDLSSRVVAAGRRAIFGRNSFRGEGENLKERYFHQRKEGWQVTEEVRKRVCFRQGNLVSQSWPEEAAWDLIFCRNVLIYFDEESQKKALGTLGRSLAPGGLLFVGAAEAFLTQSHGFKAAGWPGVFSLLPPAPRPVAAAPPPARSRKAPPKPLPATPRASPAPPPPAPTRPPKPDLAQVTQLADAGQLPEARDACEAWLREHESSAEGYYLLGVVRDSLGDTQGARESYRRALYLEPRHPEALRHLALLKEKGGDLAGARRLHHRARRSEEATLS